MSLFLTAKNIDVSSFKGTPDSQFAKWLSTTHKLQGIPPSAFYSDEHKSYAKDYIRFCFFKVSLWVVHPFFLFASAAWTAMSRLKLPNREKTAKSLLSALCQLSGAFMNPGAGTLRAGALITGYEFHSRGFSSCVLLLAINGKIASPFRDLLSKISVPGQLLGSLPTGKGVRGQIRCRDNRLPTSLPWRERLLPAELSIKEISLASLSVVLRFLFGTNTPDKTRLFRDEL